MSQMRFPDRDPYAGGPGDVLVSRLPVVGAAAQRSDRFGSVLIRQIRTLPSVHPADIDRLDRVRKPAFLQKNDNPLAVSGRPEIEVEHRVLRCEGVGTMPAA
jgi:hypothetical protein